MNIKGSLKEIREAESALVQAALNGDSVSLAKYIDTVANARIDLEKRKKLWLKRKIELNIAERNVEEVSFGLESDLQYLWLKEYVLLGDELKRALLSYNIDDQNSFSKS